MTGKHAYDPQKTLEVLLYISGRCSDMYHVLKVIFFADQKHLARYGRLMTGDRYEAMWHGPVPSGAYDMVNLVRGVSFSPPAKWVLEALAVKGYDLKPLRQPDLDYLSLSERECLDEAIKEIKDLTFGQLRAKAHAAAPRRLRAQDDSIPLEALVRNLDGGDVLWQYVAGC